MPPYSPERRTALVLCGTGVHGAYHAGVLRALQEAGVKIDVFAGHGVGAATAALGAVDGAARLWEPGGIWTGTGLSSLYGWTRHVRVAAWLAAALAVAVLSPVLVLVLGAVVYALAFVLGMAGASAGTSLTAVYGAWLQNALSGGGLPTIVPRIVMLVAAALLLWVAVSAVQARWSTTGRRRARGPWWWHVVGAPLDASSARDAFGAAIDQIVRGGATGDPSRTGAVGRRYADLLLDNLGQPGFRELVLVTMDLDARRDVVAALLREPYRHEFLAPRAGRDRQAEVLDLAGQGRDHSLDVVAAALTPPGLCEPQRVTFAPDSFWRGETHRWCDRPAAARLLEEVAATGASQAIVVSAVAPMGKPHRLSVPRLDLRGRLAESIAAGESAALRDALDLARLRFDSVYVICPPHNPLGAFDVGGAFDDASDRWQPVSELLDRAYEDAYRQFIEPVVGASGEHLARPLTPGRADPDRLG